MRATKIRLTDKDRKILESRIRNSKTEQRQVLRARIILAAAQGETTIGIAKELKVRPNTVSKWRTRFAKEGLSGLDDAERPGKPSRYQEDTDRRVLSKLDETPPEGYSRWNGRLLAAALGDVTKHQVWRILRRLNISLERRRSWCISTDPEFARKAADIVGLYLDPPENAMVICVDEKPQIQALERAQGWLKLPNGRALTGFSHGYKRHGTTTLFAALEVTTGQVKAGHYNRRRRVEFLDFMNQIVADYPDQELHVILDNLNTHKPKNDMWLKRHPNVKFHYTPTSASWLNQIEVWFSILSRSALKGANFTSPQQVRESIDKFIKVYNPQAEPFQWRKRYVYPKSLAKRISDLCN
jgi:transposase